MPDRRAGRSRAWRPSARTCTRATSYPGDGGNEDIFDGAAQVSGAAPNLTHFASRGMFAGGIFDLWMDLDGSGEVDIDELGEQLNVADLKAWLRNPPGAKPMAA